MNRYKDKLLGFGLAVGLGLSLASTSAFAVESDSSNTTVGSGGPSAEAMAFDGIVVRPLSLAGSIISTVFFVVTLPFSAIGGNADEAAHNMVAKPFAYTFTRPLGEGE